MISSFKVLTTWMLKGTFQDLVDKATEGLMNTGEMVGKMSKNEKDDDENDSDDENDKAKKRPAR